MERPSRKPNRLKHFDYSQPNAYFITICTEHHRMLFWKRSSEKLNDVQKAELSREGEIVDAVIREISQHYPAVTLEHYVVMPNHIHLLLRIGADQRGRPMAAPTISTVVQQMKGAATKRIGHAVWQKLFHDHVVRDERDYERIWTYIDTNPARWEEDCFYTAEER